MLDRAVHVLVERLPYVTLLLRLRGNTPVERAALDRRREFDRAVTALVVEARDAGELRADIDPRVAERLLFGMINSIVEWYRPEGPEDARASRPTCSRSRSTVCACRGLERTRRPPRDDCREPRECFFERVPC